MRCLYRFCMLSSFALLAFTFVSAQSQGQLSNSHPRPVRFSEYLADRGIVTPEQVVAALHDPSPEIRPVAAFRLVELRLPTAANLINAAAATEQDESVAINFYSALWSLNDLAGRKHLASICSSPATGEDDALSAATQMAYHKGGTECTQNLARLFTSTGSARKAQYLVLLSNFTEDPSLSKADMSALISAATLGLDDLETSTRIEAVRLAQKLADPRAVELLRKQRLSERDPAVLRQLKSASVSMQRERQDHVPTTTEAVRPQPACAPATTCPTASNIGTRTVIPFQSQIPNLKTGMGIFVGIDVSGTQDNYDGMSVVEQVSLAASDCPFQGLSGFNACAGNDTFTVGSGVNEGGFNLPPVQNRYYDFHEITSQYNLLAEYNSNNPCSVDCRQSYSCNGSNIGNYFITQDFSAVTREGSDQQSYNVTLVTEGDTKQ